MWIVGVWSHARIDHLGYKRTGAIVHYPNGPGVVLRMLSYSERWIILKIQLDMRFGALLSCCLSGTWVVDPHIELLLPRTLNTLRNCACCAGSNGQRRHDTRGLPRSHGVLVSILQSSHRVTSMQVYHNPSLSCPQAISAASVGNPKEHLFSSLGGLKFA